MNEVMVREYLGNGIGFKVIDGMVYANATEMAKVFGKLPADWIRLKQTQEYVDELKSVMGNHISLIDTVKGGNFSEQGTWIHEKLVLDFAKWLNIKFRVWADETIATLIREGSVSIEPQFKAPTTLKEALLLALEQQEKIEQLELENKTKEVKLVEQAPKVEFADKLLKSKCDILIGDFAKVMADENLAIGSKRLFTYLRDKKYIYNDRGSNKPYQIYVDKGYFKLKENVINSAFKDFVTYTTLLTPSGQVWLYNKLKEEEQFKK